MKSSDLKVATHADIVNIRYCVFCQPGGVPHTLAVCANWLNVHAGIMYKLFKLRYLSQNYGPGDLRYVSFILPQRSVIEGRLASTDRNMSNAPESTAICDPTAISRFETLTPLSCTMLLANSTTVKEITLLEYSSHARTSGSCMTVSRSAECLRNVSLAGLTFSLPPVAMVEDHRFLCFVGGLVP